MTRFYWESKTSELYYMYKVSAPGTGWYARIYFNVMGKWTANIDVIGHPIFKAEYKTLEFAKQDIQNTMDDIYE